MPIRSPLLALFLLLVAGLCFGAAQTAAPGASAAPPPVAANSAEAAAGSRLRVYLLTFGPGSEVWEKFGHNAVEVVDPDRNLDFSCNWGVFDFFQQGFYRRFIFGQMLYRCAAEETGPMLEQYKSDNRTIYRQELNLSPAQKASLYDFVAWNIQPENCNYRYDYYRDNCSTRTRDAIDRALGGQIRAQLEPLPTATTYRFHTRRIMADNLPLYTSLLFVLGHPVDRPLSEWQESFLPLQLMQHLRHVTISDDTGHTVALIKSEDVVFQASRPPQRSTPPNWILPFLLAGLAIAALFLWLTSAARRSRAARILLVLMGMAWALLIGFAGAFALWGWTCTEHVAVYYNENILQFSPLALPLVILLPLAMPRRRRVPRSNDVPASTSRIANVASVLAIATAASSLLGLILKALPAFYQVNWELIAWVLPANLAFALAVWQITAKTATPSPQPKDDVAGTRPLPQAP